jgi:hypothetical protein
MANKPRYRTFDGKKFELLETSGPGSVAARASKREANAWKEQGFSVRTFDNAMYVRKRR